MMVSLIVHESHPTAYLEGQESALHSEVCTDVLVDSPCKLIVQFPGNNRHHYCKEPNDARNRNQVWSNIGPNRNAGLHPSFDSQFLNCLVDLVVLNGRIN